MIPGAFTYKNINSTKFNIISKSVNRALLPPMRPKTIEIPGVHGSIDFGGNTYGTRRIVMRMAYVGLDYEELRARARDIARWLTSIKNEPLVFDDEPDKCYLARIYDEVGLSNFFRLGESNITFECQPFAESLEYRQVNIPSINQNPYEIPVFVNGTSETSCIITIKNTGTTNISNISIRRKAEI